MLDKDYIRIAKMTLELLEKKNWNLITLKNIKLYSRVKKFDKLIKNKPELLKNINSYFDYKIILNIKNIENSNQKDMIFEILMMRFDIIQENRKAVISIFKSFTKNPNELIFLLPKLIDSMVLMMSYAKISNKGILGQMKIKGLLIIYIATFFTWMKDETASLEKTMTALDSYLNKASDILRFSI